MKRPFVVLLFSACFATDAYAHPIHTTLNKVSIEKHAITLQVRTFADDFSATVAKFAGRRPPMDSSVVAAEVLKYAQSFFVVTTASGAPAVLESCGITRTNELSWLCFRAKVPSRGARVRNHMLTEMHADQVNIVQMEPPAARRTMLFTRGSPFAVVGQ